MHTAFQLMIDVTTNSLHHQVLSPPPPPLPPREKSFPLHSSSDTLEISVEVWRTVISHSVCACVSFLTALSRCR